MLAAAAAHHLSRFDAALPFLVSALLVFVGAVFALLVSDGVESSFAKWAKEADVKEEDLPYSFRPKTIGKTSVWIIDTSQVLTAMLAPFVGLALLLHRGASGDLLLVYLIALVFAATIFVLVLRRGPDKYGWRLPGPITPVVVLTVLVNLGGAYAAYKIGP